MDIRWAPPFGPADVGSRRGRGPLETTTRLEAGPDAAATAHRTVEQALRDAVPARVITDLEAMIAELVAGSVGRAGLSAQDEVVLHLQTSGSTIYVEVSEHGPGFERSAPTEGPDDARWGLYLVEKLSDQWGVIREAPFEVWFQVNVERH